MFVRVAHLLLPWTCSSPALLKYLYSAFLPLPSCAVLILLPLLTSVPCSPLVPLLFYPFPESSSPRPPPLPPPVLKLLHSSPAPPLPHPSYVPPLLHPSPLRPLPHPSPLPPLLHLLPHSSHHSSSSIFYPYSFPSPPSLISTSYCSTSPYSLPSTFCPSIHTSTFPSTFHPSILASTLSPLLAPLHGSTLLFPALSPPFSSFSPLSTSLPRPTLFHSRPQHPRHLSALHSTSFHCVEIRTLCRMAYRWSSLSRAGREHQQQYFPSFYY